MSPWKRRVYTALFVLMILFAMALFMFTATGAWPTSVLLFFAIASGCYGLFQLWT